MTTPKISRRERDTIVSALRAGVVPRLGLQHIQVGRKREVTEMLKDIDRIADGGSTIRFVIGEYGSGKTFFLNLARVAALRKGVVVMSTDLGPDRRLYATGGQARSLIAELTRNTSTRTRLDGSALASVVERFVTQAIRDAEERRTSTSSVVRTKLSHLEELTSGYDFATVISRYWEGYELGDETLQTSALRWLRAEFATRTEAREALGVRTIIDDAGVFRYIRVFVSVCYIPVLRSRGRPAGLPRGSGRDWRILPVGGNSRLGTAITSRSSAFERCPAGYRDRLWRTDGRYP